MVSFSTLLTLSVLLITQSALSSPVPHARAPTLTLSTPYGNVLGVPSSNAVRFTLPYAAPPVGDLRFANPQLITRFAKNAGASYNATQTPPACYQYEDDPRGGNLPSEDCLYSTYYKPASATSWSKLPVLVHVHGGSNMAGSSTDEGLDGSCCASSQNVIVVVVQYRLGLFGFLNAPDLVDEANGGAPGAAKVGGNMALRDLVAALQQVRAVVASLGGDAGNVTLMGHSSGGQLVRALLTTPAAAPLFSRAILWSDTQDYGPSTQADSNLLGSFALEQLGCSDLACLRAKDKDDVNDASFAAYQVVPTQHGSVAAGTAFRPTLGSYFTSALEIDAADGKAASKPVLFTTVANEAGATAGNLFQASDACQSTVTLRNDGIELPFNVAAGLVFNDGRGDIIADVPAYTMADSANLSIDQSRSIFEGAVTDGLWRCAVQTNARNLAVAGGSAWLAQIDIGSQYPSNAGVDYCDGKVCHEDDIYIVFGTAPSPSSAVKAATTELQARFAAFAKWGNPNPWGYKKWDKISSGTKLNALRLGADGQSSFMQTQLPDVCGGSMWGNTVKFDWQLYSH